MSATTKTDHTLERLVFFSDAALAIAILLPRYAQLGLVSIALWRRILTRGMKPA